MWGIGTPIIVVTQETPGATGDEPSRFTWQGQDHQVAEIAKAWRVDIEWWRKRIWRAYFKLSTNSGLLVIIYQDLVSNDWYLQRLYD